MSNGQLTLLSASGERFPADVRMKDLSVLVRHIVDDSSTSEEIPLVSVASPVLVKVLEYCIHHDYTSPHPLRKPIPTDRIEDAVDDPWDSDFIRQFSDDMLVDLTLASNYMDIRSLLDLCCAKLATIFKGRTVDELRLKYGIAEEYTAEEEERMKREFPWAVDGDEDYKS